MLALCLAGVLERHPALRLGFFEAGCGWAPYWVERIEEHFELAPDDFAGGDPHGTLASRTWLTFEVDERTLPAVLDLGWRDNVCFASDYPHYDAPFPGAVDAVRARGLGRRPRAPHPRRQRPRLLRRTPPPPSLTPPNVGAA